MKTPPYFLIGSFLAFVEAKNMMAAAEALEISQPALTRHLQLIETYFTQKIFTIEGRKKVLTAFGRELYELLNSKFNHLEKDLSRLQLETQNPKNLKIKISGRAELLSYMASRLDFPGTLIFASTDGRQAVQDLVNRDCDIALSNHLEKAQSLISKKLFTDQFAIYFPKTWKIDGATINTHNLEQLCQKNFLAYKEGDKYLEHILRAHDCHLRPRTSKVLQDWNSLLAMAAKERAWTIAPDRFFPQNHGLTMLPLRTGIVAPTDFYLLYRRESTTLPWWKEWIRQFHQFEK